MVSRGANTERRGTLLRLSKDKRGNALMTIAAAMIPLIAAIGAGVDMSRAYLVQNKLQNACDAGLLAARRKMVGTAFDDSAKAEGAKFFAFNFPARTMDVSNLRFEQGQASVTESEINGVASASVPTTLIRLFGKQTIDVSVKCDADSGVGKNDVMLVLDMTGSMFCKPEEDGSCGALSDQSGSRLSYLRDALPEVYKGLGDDARYGFMPYSSTVNVGMDLRSNDILRAPYYWKHKLIGPGVEQRDVNILGLLNILLGVLFPTQEAALDTWRAKSGESSDGWNAASRPADSGACIEERPSQSTSGWGKSFTINTTVTQADIDAQAINGTDTARQWGRYDPNSAKDHLVDIGYTSVLGWSACPARAKKLAIYNSQADFDAAALAATSHVSGPTYHDIGMIWALRYLSPTGMFKAENGGPGTENVKRHIIFMTDGETSPSLNAYTAYGIESLDARLGAGDLATLHNTAFQSACDRAKAMGVTVWVIGFATSDEANDKIKSCATSSSHFFPANGTNLKGIFQAIATNISHLRLTR